MLNHTHILAFIFAAFAFSAPAFADGTGKGPTYVAPAPLTAQPHTRYLAPQPTTYHSGTLCHSSCGQSTGLSHSGLPTNPRQTCCGHTPAPAPVYHAPAPQPVYHAPAPVVQQVVQQGMTLDISGFDGGVGVGVNDVFVGGGGFGNGFVGSTGASAGFVGFRSVNRGNVRGGKRGFRGSRSGFRGASRGGNRGRRGGGRRGGGRH